MKRIPLTRGKFALVDDRDFMRVAQFKWSAIWNGHTWYASRSVGKRPNRQQMLMHRFILALPIGRTPQADHRNLNGLDNRRRNLRPATPSQNNANTRYRKNKSGFKGVSWHNRDHLWVARIRVHPKRILLGYFKSAKDAAQAYKKAALLFFGAFTRT